ncbi:GTP-binding protein [Candidatus Arthromitus sp. SFB-mouse-SU]|uniref:GTPase HflX n=1 Tax=Candidatus Arthromitus sp. SFB-mouse TaxID=49118 RepID=UPI00022968A7|nr:GTPase HflX [Candidatus Arthromitus sp. SFB-mouse]EIA24886.1 GTP-binding protein [Candidatus Arthromitus sp. SFB-2]EIA27321.1 GTP-binding protein [Candidatus Arthromitus sp. SFB-co]EIA30244.1 GTP-binding protein [Candidatus Arthromitus sp. SFB-4]EIA30915.1 GTP-binding protein [Candidatus Arthromitus sp. SFB-mouse-SU]EGX28679.1 GTP binding protein [Candidatus Arthromitus sp. SFB-mouse-NYU]
MIYGDTNGIKRSYLNELEDIYDIRLDKNLIISEEILYKICEISFKINKEICIVLLRNGNVHSISIGTNADAKIHIDLKDKKKLSGCRVIHTHLNSSPKLSDVDIASLKNLRLDAISAVNVTNENLFNGFSIGMLNNGDNEYEEYVFYNLKDYLDFNIFSKIQDIEKNFKVEIYENEISDNCVLIGCDTLESLEELRELAYACNINVKDMFFQNRDKADSVYYIGKGKIKEILNSIYHRNITLLIFDDDLSGSQIRVLEEMSGIRVIDRTTLILEIFNRRAKSKVSKYQVELAMLKYKYSKLRGLSSDLNRTSGGIGLRGGSGETKLETDRRYVRSKIDYLKKEIEKIKLERSVQRDARIKNNIPQVSIVGYTNAGKSTLRNYIYSTSNVGEVDLDKKLVIEADMLFATLDTTVRKILLPRKTLISLTDTVGFIKKLPHDLVDAFKSTLEEVIYSSLLLHVVDISSNNFEVEINTTDNVLKEIGIKNLNRILIFNKIDKLKNSELEELKSKIYKLYPSDKIVFISVIEKINIDKLLNLVEETLSLNYQNVSLLIPYDDYSILNSVYESYKIIKEKHLDKGTFVNFDIPKSELDRFKKYIIEDLEN